MDRTEFLKRLREGRIRRSMANEAINIGTTVTRLLRANPRRCGYRFSHQSANRLHFAEGDPQVSTTSGDEVSRGTIIIQDFEPGAGGIGFGIQDEVWAIFETASADVLVTEYEIEE